VLGVGCQAGGVAKPNTQHPRPKTLLGTALGIRYVQSHYFGRAQPTIDNKLPKEKVQQICEALKGL